MSFPDSKICATCRRPLNSWRAQDGSGDVEYRHAVSDDCPEVVPIDPDGGNVIYSCDFCLELHPRWTFPANTVVEHGLTGTDDPFVSDEEWASCDTCKPLVEAKNWRALWARNRHLKMVRDSYPQNFHAARLAVLRLWLEFDRQRTGPPYLEQVRISNDDFADAIKAIVGKEEP